jgi:hypothetical protein
MPVEDASSAVSKYSQRPGNRHQSLLFCDYGVWLRGVRLEEAIKARHGSAEYRITQVLCTARHNARQISTLLFGPVAVSHASGIHTIKWRRDSIHVHVPPLVYLYYHIGRKTHLNLDTSTNPSSTHIATAYHAPITRTALTTPYDNINIISHGSSTTAPRIQAILPVLLIAPIQIWARMRELTRSLRALNSSLSLDLLSSQLLSQTS